MDVSWTCGHFTTQTQAPTCSLLHCASYDNTMLLVNYIAKQQAGNPFSKHANSSMLLTVDGLPVD